jgi:subtilisin family serine protease
MRPSHRRGPVLVVALATASALLAAPAVPVLADEAPPATAASEPGAVGGDAAGQDDAGGAAASGSEVASDTLLVTAERRRDVAAARDALADVAEVSTVSRRVLAVDGDHDEVRRALADHPVTIERDVVLRGARWPNDPLVGTQWGLENTGQTINGRTGEEGLDVGARRAWVHTRGSRTVTIAVVDTRIYSHPDLDANLVRGSADAFVTDNPNRPCNAQYAAHATEVAGVAAAVADNGLGIAGLAPRSRIMPVAFLDNCGYGSLRGAAQAITWAAQRADVVIASFASEGAVDPTALRSAIEDAGVPVVAAAGNAVPGGAGEGADLSASGSSPVYPASFSLRNLLAVASIDNDGELSRFSNHGRLDVELGAPGRDIRTTSVNYRGAPGYRYQSGTSFAAPFVAAAVALGRSLQPVLSSEALLDLTRRTTRPLPSLRATTISGGTLDAGELVVQLARGGGCPTELVPTAGFRDLAAMNAHRLAVDCIAWWDITQGRSGGTFDVDAPVTRGQMATFLAAIIEEGPGLPSSPPPAFDDVRDGVHQPAIDALAELGIVGGFPDGTYRQGSTVSRAQMATFLVNTYEHVVGDVRRPRERWFEDTGGSVHADSAEALWKLGITAGVRPRTYAPRPDVRRDQMASFLARLLDRVVREGVVESRGDADGHPDPGDDEDGDNGGDDDGEAPDDGGGDDGDGTPEPDPDA